MTAQEVNEVYEEFRKDGTDDEGIAQLLAQAFVGGEIGKDEFWALLEPLGFELKAEYKDMPEDELRKELSEGGDEAIDGIKAGSEKAERVEELGEEEPSAHKPEPEGGEEPDEEEGEKDEAFRLMGLKKD